MYVEFSQFNQINDIFQNWRIRFTESNDVARLRHLSPVNIHANPSTT